MQLGRPGPDPASMTDLASALRATASARGHRPAITVLGGGTKGERRDEQAFASLQQWVAKGAHLLQVDADLGPGDLLAVDAPAGWMAASVCLAAWWIGAAVTDDTAAAEFVVAHASRWTGAQDGWVIGDQVDGTPQETGPGGPESWALAVQSFPDQPPPPRAGPDLPALLSAAGVRTQAEVIGQALQSPPGRLGIRGDRPLDDIAILLAARPALTGTSSVLVLHGSSADEEAERIVAWS